MIASRASVTVCVLAGVGGFLLGGLPGAVVGSAGAVPIAFGRTRVTGVAALVLLVAAGIATLLEAPLGADLGSFVANRSLAAQLGRFAGILAFVTIVGLWIGASQDAPTTSDKP